MTTVHISLGRDDGTDKTAAKGVVEWEPTTRREDGTMVILERGFTVPLVAGETSVTVDPSGLTWCWRVTERTDSGGTVRYVAVPDSATTVEYVDLPDVDPTTLVPWTPADPEAAYQSALDNLDITISTGGSSTVTYDDAPAVPAEGESASYFVTSAVVWPSGLVWSTEPDNDTAPVLTTSALVYLFTLGGVTRAVLGATFPGGEIVFEDVTAPTVGTMAISDVTATSLTMTISGAADETALHTQPYAFTTDGTTYTAYQASNAYTPTGLTPETSYTCNWRVRDAAGNVSTGTAQSQTTSALAGLTVTAGGMTATRITNPTSPYTWSAAPVGTASATRRVVASVATYLNDIACNVTALTIGGVTATRNVFYRRDTRSTIELWSAEVPTGSTADVVITWDNAPQYANVSTQIIDGAASTVIDAGTGDASATVTPSAGGVVLAGMSAYSQSAAPVEWTGVTLLHQATSLPPVTATGGAQTSSTTDVTATPTFEWTPSNLAVAAIAVGLA